jgi:hypothetical protein
MNARNDRRGGINNGAVIPARTSSRVGGRFASPNAILASGKETGIWGRGDFRVARLHDGEVAERGAEDR